MDIIAVILGALGGAITFIGGLYAYARMQGFKLLPEDLNETAEKLQDDYNGLVEEVEGAIGNISLPELGKIVLRAKELSKDGFTAAEAQELGKMMIDAAKD